MESLRKFYALKGILSAINTSQEHIGWQSEFSVLGEPLTVSFGPLVPTQVTCV
jgi:hypothetical protein